MKIKIVVCDPDGVLLDVMHINSDTFDRIQAFAAAVRSAISHNFRIDDEDKRRAN